MGALRLVIQWLNVKKQFSYCHFSFIAVIPSNHTLTSLYVSEVLNYRFKGDITHYFAASTQQSQLLQPFIAHSCLQHVFYHRQFVKRTLPRAVGDRESEKQSQTKLR